MLTGTVDFYTLSLTLTLPGGHKVSVKQTLLASFFPHAFLLIRIEFWCDVRAKHSGASSSSSSSSAFPTISMGFAILGEIFAYVIVFNSTIEVLTFCLRRYPGTDFE